MKFRAKRWVQFTVLFIVAFSLVAWFVLREQTIMTLSTSQVSSVVIHEMDWIGDAPKEFITSDDPQSIASLIEMLQLGSPTSSHKCLHVGTITLTLPQGTKKTVLYLPGHNDAYYEYISDGKCYRVPREQFVDAMKKLRMNVPLKCN